MNAPEKQTRTESHDVELPEMWSRTTLAQFVESLQVQADKVGAPPTAEIYFDAQETHNGTESFASLRWTRLETDEEERTRIDRENREANASLQRRIAQFQQLKKELGL
jgi:hypothetical protein